MKHVTLLLLLSLTCSARAAEAPKFEFHDGDRIALIGNEFFEREQDQGYIETQLTTRFADKNLTFRNLGYSGDTVWADARSLCNGWATFGPPDQGFGRLTRLVEHIKPTVIFVAYGMNESFEGQKGLAHFEQGLARMLDMLAGTKARIVLFTPIRHEDLPRPLPDPSRHNINIRLYCDALAKTASERHYPVIDLYTALGDGTKSDPAGAFTSDGIHLTPYGYWRVAQVIERELGYQPRTWDVQIDPEGKHTAVGTKLSDVKTTDRGVSFTATDEALPLAPPPAEAPSGADQRRMTLRVTGLPTGTYVLQSEGVRLASGSAEQWAKGINLVPGPALAQEEQLRKLVIGKNRDFFNYWRPQNDTYIFGYRNHEQGRNAVEIPRFEPLAAQKEQQIAKLRAPVAHAFELVREQ